MSSASAQRSVRNAISTDGIHELPQQPKTDQSQGAGNRNPLPQWDCSPEEFYGIRLFQMPHGKQP